MVNISQALVFSFSSMNCQLYNFKCQVSTSAVKSNTRQSPITNDFVTTTK